MGGVLPLQDDLKTAKADLDELKGELKSAVKREAAKVRGAPGCVGGGVHVSRRVYVRPGGWG